MIPTEITIAKLLVEAYPDLETDLGIHWAIFCRDALAERGMVRRSAELQASFLGGSGSIEPIVVVDLQSDMTAGRLFSRLLDEAPGACIDFVVLAHGYGAGLTCEFGEWDAEQEHVGALWAELLLSLRDDRDEIPVMEDEDT